MNVLVSWLEIVPENEIIPRTSTRNPTKNRLAMFTHSLKNGVFYKLHMDYNVRTPEYKLAQSSEIVVIRIV